MELTVMTKHTLKVPGKLVYAVRDEYGLIQVIDTTTTRSLYFNSPVQQSCLYLQAPMSLSFEYQQLILDRIDQYLNKSAVNTTLMLGLGGGSLTNHLHCMLPKAQHTVIELREEVIHIAKEYFYLTDDEHITTLATDASEYVKTSPPNDIFVVDLYDESGMPEAFKTTEFLEDMLALKTTKNLIIFNLWTSTPQESLKIIKYWEKQGCFRIQIAQTQSSGNLILSIE